MNLIKSLLLFITFDETVCDIIDNDIATIEEKNHNDSSIYDAGILDHEDRYNNCF